MSIPAFPFDNIPDERLYRLHKLYAESYVTNLRNLEAPWKPVITSILEAIVKKVREDLDVEIDIAVQQEQPLAPPALAAASVDADSTMTASKHKGTVYPDVSVLRYLFDVNADFRTLTRASMGHNEVDYLVCAELKRSTKRALISRGLKYASKGYRALSKSLRDAALQAARQAFLATSRPGQANSDVILIAAAGPFWMWCLANHVQLRSNFPGMDVEDILNDVQDMRDRDSTDELASEPEVDDGNFLPISSALHGAFTPISSALLDPMSKKHIFIHPHVLTWSSVVMLDTGESETELRSILENLTTVCLK